MLRVVYSYGNSGRQIVKESLAVRSLERCKTELWWRHELDMIYWQTALKTE